MLERNTKPYLLSDEIAPNIAAHIGEGEGKCERNVHSASIPSLTRSSPIFSMPICRTCQRGNFQHARSLLR